MVNWKIFYGEKNENKNTKQNNIADFYLDNLLVHLSQFAEFVNGFKVFLVSNAYDSQSIEYDISDSNKGAQIIRVNILEEK